MQRPAPNKILKDLERDGIISIGHSTIDITDPKELSDRAVTEAASPWAGYAPSDHD
ncbi:hypothetical protein ACQCSU_17180 [Pseudarthrobacter sp. O4]|uniref:hypothetical protein n=1 Tax=Pseudarthrobacter sp. O4 TaxID=3418417 RepID=UPI003CF569F2